MSVASLVVLLVEWRVGDGALLCLVSFIPFRQTRKDFITAKYTEKRFVRRLSTDGESRLQRLYEAVRNRDILSLIQVYAEGADLMESHSQPNEHVRTNASQSIIKSSLGVGWSSDLNTYGRKPEKLCFTWQCAWVTETPYTLWTSWPKTGEPTPSEGCLAERNS